MYKGRFGHWELKCFTLLRKHLENLDTFIYDFGNIKAELQAYSDIIGKSLKIFPL